MKNKIIIFMVLAVLLLVTGCTKTITGDNSVGASTNQIPSKIMFYKSPNCGCCKGHAGVLESEGFDVNIVESDTTLGAIKDKYAIPAQMRSCHTSVIGDYFVEGHVPSEAINKLLAEKPDIDGIALPGMPAGSAGMMGSKSEPFTIYAIKDGEVSEFMKV